MNLQFDSKEFRTVLGHFPTGVVIISGLDNSGRPQGLTIGSFSSISLDPPLVGFFPGLNSKSWPAIAESGAFCVNVFVPFSMLVLTYSVAAAVANAGT